MVSHGVNVKVRWLKWYAKGDQKRRVEKMNGDKFLKEEMRKEVIFCPYHNWFDTPN